MSLRRSNSLPIITTLTRKKKIPTSEPSTDTSICRRVAPVPWQPPYGMGGAVQNKAADAAMIAQNSFTAAAGHACGKDFKAASPSDGASGIQLAEGFARDMDAYPWTTFSVSK